MNIPYLYEEGSDLTQTRLFSHLLQQTSRSFRMNSQLTALFDGLPMLAVSGNLNVEVTSLSMDSRRIVQGGIFFALDGFNTDGNFYLEEAVDRGAVCIVSEKAIQLPERCAAIQVQNIREVIVEVSRRFYGYPDRKLDLVGITGTNGKTTVIQLVRFLLEEPNHPVGSLDTISYCLGLRRLPATRSTPESIDIQAMLAQMVGNGCSQCVMEVSSHGLDQKRVYQLPFKVAAFLNLTRDHIDYHGDLDTYFAAKARLFNGLNGGVPEIAVVNLDDPWGVKLLDILPGDVRKVTFGMDQICSHRISDLQLNAHGSQFNLTVDGRVHRVQTRLLGSYNCSNAVAALTIAEMMGVPLQTAISKLKSFHGVPGRMETIQEGQPFNVVVDYAHTDDALRNAIQMLRQLTRGRILVVFGCGGNRDRSKRSPMTRVVQEESDLCWITADNPRSEELEQIFADMRLGVIHPHRVRFVESRRWSIHLAIEESRPGDTLLIAGKGHEAFQEYATTVVPFDDRTVARELLSKKFSRFAERSMQ
jgi:UDP-N-acetylmuramoyl-L-alanyl-D-glutamate--2,6-diaminopimelate ligase